MPNLIFGLLGLLVYWLYNGIPWIKKKTTTEYHHYKKDEEEEVVDKNERIVTVMVPSVPIP
jgi:hypothetical protein